MKVLIHPGHFELKQVELNFEVSLQSKHFVGTISFSMHLPWKSAIVILLLLLRDTGAVIMHFIRSWILDMIVETLETAVSSIIVLVLVLFTC